MNDKSKSTHRMLLDVSQARAPMLESVTRNACGLPDQDAEQLTKHTSLWSRVGFLVRRLHQIHIAIFRAELADYEITPVQYGLLSVLVERPGFDQVSVARELGIDRANVHDVLRRLEARKLLIRVADPHNRRRKICLATMQGTKLVAELQSAVGRAQDRLIESLTGAECATFKALLYKLIEANTD